MSKYDIWPNDIWPQFECQYKILNVKILYSASVGKNVKIRYSARFQMSKNEKQKAKNEKRKNQK